MTPAEARELRTSFHAMLRLTGSKAHQKALKWAVRQTRKDNETSNHPKVCIRSSSSRTDWLRK